MFGQVYDETIEYRISSIEPNSGIDKYRRNQVSNQHYCRSQGTSAVILCHRRLSSATLTSHIPINSHTSSIHDFLGLAFFLVLPRFLPLAVFIILPEILAFSHLDGFQ